MGVYWWGRKWNPCNGSTTTNHNSLFLIRSQY